MLHWSDSLEGESLLPSWYAVLDLLVDPQLLSWVSHVGAKTPKAFG